MAFRGQGRPRTRGPLSFENEPGYLRALIPPRVGPSRCLVRLTWQPRRLSCCLAPTFREQSVAALRRALPRRVNALLGRWRRAMAVAAAVPAPSDRRAAELAAIVRLCRALALGHYFPDANARTACTLVLHKLLFVHGDGPVVLDAPYVMDGYFSTPEMVACLERGFDNVRRVRAAFGDGEGARAPGP